MPEVIQPQCFNPLIRRKQADFRATCRSFLDLTEVKYTDSSGLSALLVGNRILQEDNGMFVLAGLSEHTAKLIKISQLDSVLHIVPTHQEAIDAVFLHEIEKDMKAGTN